MKLKKKRDYYIVHNSDSRIRITPFILLLSPNTLF